MSAVEIVGEKSRDVACMTRSGATLSATPAEPLSVRVPISL